MTREFNIIKYINIKTNDRISVFGRTGSGKTFFAKNWLLPQYGEYVFWDVKSENNDIIHEVLTTTPEELNDNIYQYKKILYQPKDPSKEDFNKICEIIFNNRNKTLYVDEATLISTPSIIQYWHNVILTQGRSYDVGIINASQRPRIIHNTIISESEHMFVFSLNLETDIYKVKQQIGDDAANEIRHLPEYHFLYHSVRENKSFLFKPVEPFIKDEPIKRLELYQPNLEEYIEIQGILEYEKSLYQRKPYYPYKYEIIQIEDGKFIKLDDFTSDIEAQTFIDTKERTDKNIRLYSKRI